MPRHKRGAFLEKQSSQPDFIYREKCSNTVSTQYPTDTFDTLNPVDERQRDRGNVLLRNNEGDLRRYRRKVLQHDGSIDTANGKVWAGSDAREILGPKWRT